MHIIVTGASRGIGYELVQILAKDPANQILALSRNTEKLEALCAPLDNAEFIAYDLSKGTNQKVLEKLKEWGKLDLLVNNAGLLIKKGFVELDMEDWKRSFEVNVFGVVSLIQTCFPFLKESPKAHILNISSMGGFQGSSKFPGLSAYSASKAALGNLTECLAEEFKEMGIAVNALALGAVKTEMLEEAFPGYVPPVNAQEMAGFMANFATSGHHFFNGKILPVSVSTP